MRNIRSFLLIYQECQNSSLGASGASFKLCQKPQEMLSLKYIRSFLLIYQEPQNSSLRTLWCFFHFFQNGWEANYCSIELEREGRALKDDDDEPLGERVGAVGGRHSSEVWLVWRILFSHRHHHPGGDLWSNERDLVRDQGVGPFDCLQGQRLLARGWQEVEH